MRAAWFLLLLTLTACGDSGDPTPPLELIVPTEPEAALAWVRAAQDDETGLRARLDRWPWTAEDFVDADETQIALTWRLMLAVQDGDVVLAASLFEKLDEQFEGEGVARDGRELRRSHIRLGIFEEALLAARNAVAGTRPSHRAARAALQVAETMHKPQAIPPASGFDARKLAGMRAWVEAKTADDVLGPIGAERLGAPKQATLVVIADEFSLGEDLFFEVLRQWARDYAKDVLARRLVPIKQGVIRMGLRRVPVEDVAEEILALRKRAKSEDLAWSRIIRAEALTALGLTSQDTILLLCNEEGGIVARLAGRNIDPREIQPALQKLLTR